MINLRPTSAVEIQLIVEECEDRLSEEQVDSIAQVYPSVYSLLFPYFSWSINTLQSWIQVQLESTAIVLISSNTNRGNTTRIVLPNCEFVAI